MRQNLFLLLFCALITSVNALENLLTRLGIADKINVVFEKIDATKIDGEKTNGEKIDATKPNPDLRFKTAVVDNRLIVKGTSNVALAHGFYDYLKQHQLGIVSWTGNRFAIPEKLPAENCRELISPVPFHYYLNVVTYGYTMPYWDWARWEREIDFMALHGINMPLALVANEAISARVFRQLGWEQKAIDEFFTAPAHLPWHRMGNLANHDGGLSENWHRDQIALQHQILARMREYEMSPIMPAFAGFVPRGIEKVFPHAKTEIVKWGGFPEKNQVNYLLPNIAASAEDDPFVIIGRLFIEEWEKEFGAGTYYLADMYNEMELPIPADAKNRHEILASYGKRASESLTAKNHEIKWIMQGWMFGYHRHIWTAETLKNFLSEIPDDKIILLDLAVDYSKHFWRNGVNWEFYDGFYNKQWIYSNIPNMGGKSAPTGVMEFYANGHLEALNSPKKGRMIGIGMAPEGIENNEIIYELLSDVAWKNSATNLDEWTKNYLACRYGKTSPILEQAFRGMFNSVYKTLTDHPRFNWQTNKKNGSVRYNDEYLDALKLFFSVADEFKNEPLYEADFRELAAMFLGASMDKFLPKVYQAFAENNAEKADDLFEYVFIGGIMIEACLSKHPTLSLDRWLNFARDRGVTEDEKLLYVRNARRLITVWGPPVNDYSARIWHGLVAEFYLPRLEIWFAEKMDELRKKNATPESGESDLAQKTPKDKDNKPRETIAEFSEKWIRDGSELEPIKNIDFKQVIEFINETIEALEKMEK